MMSYLIILKRDGSRTSPMGQEQATSYLLKPDLVAPSLAANLKQVLNDIFSDGGKATSSYTFNTVPVLHASSGNGQKSVTAFFYRDGSSNYLIALGEHAGSVKGNARYTLSIYGQPTGDFRENGSIVLY